MLRALLVIVALAILVGIVLVYTGIISLHQIRPDQAPAFNVETKQLDVGPTTKNVQVPAEEMKTKQIEVPKITVTDGNQASGR